jgi:hypothetical protein
MLSKEDLENEIRQEYARWSQEPFDTVLVPDDIIKRFTDAIFCVPFERMALSSVEVRSLLSKDHRSLSRVEVGQVVNMILAVTPKDIFKTKEEYISNLGTYAYIREKFEKANQEKIKELNKKLESRVRLLGGRN